MASASGALAFSGGAARLGRLKGEVGRRVFGSATRKRETTEKPRGLAIIGVMWGEKYVDDFLRYALPTHLAPGNVPSASLSMTYLLYIEADLLERVARDPQIELLRGYGCAFEFKPIEPPAPDDDKYVFWSAICLDAVERAYELNYATVWASPDILLSADAFKVIENALRSGYRALVTQGYRCCRPGLIDAVESARRPDGSLVIEGPAATEIAARTLDIEYREWLPYDPDVRAARRLHFMWCLGDKQFVFHSFKPAPMMVWPRRRIKENFGTFDDRLIAYSRLHPTEVLLVNDTRRITNLSLGTDEPLGEVPIFDPEKDYDYAEKLLFMAFRQGPLGTLHEYQALQPMLCNVPTERMKEDGLRLALFETTRFMEQLVSLTNMPGRRLLELAGAFLVRNARFMRQKFAYSRWQTVRQNISCHRSDGLAGHLRFWRLWLANYYDLLLCRRTQERYLAFLKEVRSETREVLKFSADTMMKTDGSPESLAVQSSKRWMSRHAATDLERLARRAARRDC